MLAIRHCCADDSQDRRFLTEHSTRHELSDQSNETIGIIIYRFTRYNTHLRDLCYRLVAIRRNKGRTTVSTSTWESVLTIAQILLLYGNYKQY